LSFRPRLVFGLFFAIVLAIPLAWRPILRTWGPPAESAPPSYLPALEAARPRQPFQPGPIEDLTSMQPGYITIGDSMGGRIDPERLTALANAPIAPILQNATGTAYWFLVFKNWVVASHVKPKRVVIFFRDTNLTDPMFRVSGPYRQTLDEVARDREDELNAVLAQHTNGPWYRVHHLAASIYDVDRARDWLVPALTAWPARVVIGTARRQVLLDEINDAFALDKLRSVSQADLAAADDRDADFAAHVDTSLLPAFLELARANGIRLCFVRVMRRPTGWGEAPAQSHALRIYMRDLRAYLESHGADLLDDYDDGELAKLPYADGDHIDRDARVPYTDRFWPRLQRLPQ
jgi:hypothetical protein